MAFTLSVKAKAAPAKVVFTTNLMLEVVKLLRSI